MARKVTIPAANVPLIMSDGSVNPDWYPVFKFLETLQPLSDIDFPHDNTKSDVVRQINTQVGTSYTFQLSDSGKYVRFPNGSPVTVTVPPNSSVAFQIGTQIDVVQIGGKVTFVAGAGVTITSLQGNKSLSGVGAAATLIKSATNTWELMGSLIA